MPPFFLSCSPDFVRTMPLNNGNSGKSPTSPNFMQRYNITCYRASNQIRTCNDYPGSVPILVCLASPNKQFVTFDLKSGYHHVDIDADRLLEVSRFFIHGTSMVKIRAVMIISQSYKIGSTKVSRSSLLWLLSLLFPA